MPLPAWSRRLWSWLTGKRCSDCIYFKEVHDCDDLMFKGWKGRCSGRVEAFFVKRRANDRACGQFEPEISD